MVACTSKGGKPCILNVLGLNFGYHNWFLNILFACALPGPSTEANNVLHIAVYSYIELCLYCNTYLFNYYREEIIATCSKTHQWINDFVLCFRKIRAHALAVREWVWLHNESLKSYPKPIKDIGLCLSHPGTVLHFFSSVHWYSIKMVTSAMFTLLLTLRTQDIIVLNCFDNTILSFR